MVRLHALLPVLLSLLVALLLAAGPAGAQHGHGPPGGWDPEERQEPEYPDSDPVEEPSEPAEPVTPAEPYEPAPPRQPYEPASPAPPFHPRPPAQPYDPRPPLPEQPLPETTTQKTVAGRTAMLRTDGRAAIPRGAPKHVRQIIRMANQIVGKPYKWGGGHAGLGDSGYDCSGAVSYALIKAGLQRSSMVSGSFARTYAGGEGRYVTIYAHSTHVYMEVAGLRLDTSPYGDSRQRRGVRWRPVVGRRSGFKVRHPVGL